MNISSVKNETDEVQLDEQLVERAVRLNTRLLAIVFGCLFGFSLFGMTYLSLFRGLPDTGQLLNLLGIFLPGYEVSYVGAWVGLFWGAVLGAFFAVMFYRIYAPNIPAQTLAILEQNVDPQDLTSATLFINGKTLGISLGAIVALGLIISTNWLVLRGTAEQSVHAKLLVNFLPGYSIDFIGSLIGALEMFLIAFLASMVFSKIYNSLAAVRSGKSQ